MYNFRNVDHREDALAADLPKLTPARVRAASFEELDDRAGQIRQFLVDAPVDV